LSSARFGLTEHDAFRHHLLRLDGPTRIERFGRGVANHWLLRYDAETDWLRGAVVGMMRRENRHGDWRDAPCYPRRDERWIALLTGDGEPCPQHR
jgi:hypothetical protein